MKSLWLRIGMICGALALTTGCKRPAALAEAGQPNILLILTDDQGWGDLGANGNSNIHTPNLDALAGEGAALLQFMVQPVCSPTRAELLTGRFFPSLGVTGTSAGGERMAYGVPTLGDMFLQAGYRTGLFGKWHNGSQAPYHPICRGFEEFYGFASGHWAHYFSPELEHNGTLIRGRGFLPDDLTDRAMAFISQKNDQPFFAMLCYNTPHSPMQVPDSLWKTAEHREIGMRYRNPELEDTLYTRAALALVENIDWNIGRLMHHLEKNGMASNTLVIFLSDNGPNSYRWNGGLRGRKGSTDEGGVKTSFLIRWPGRIQARSRIETLGGSVDLLPTLAGLTGTPLPEGLQPDGLNLAPYILGERFGPRPGLLYHHWGEQTSVRSQEFRLDAEGRLYHMVRDPGQQTDLAGAYPKVRDSLLRAREAWLKQVAPNAAVRQRPFTLGYPGLASTVLPARDGTAGLPVVRSNPYPNASYFTGWDSDQGVVWWPVEAYEKGEFEVTLYYACPEVARGLEIRLENASGTVAATIREPHPAVDYGAAWDRIPRIESYAKDFRSLTLGTLKINEGADTLSLRAGGFPPGAYLEVQRLVLRKIAD